MGIRVLSRFGKFINIKRDPSASLGMTEKKDYHPPCTEENLYRKKRCNKQICKCAYLAI